MSETSVDLANAFLDAARRFRRIDDTDQTAAIAHVRNAMARCGQLLYQARLTGWFESPIFRDNVEAGVYVREHEWASDWHMAMNFLEVRYPGEIPANVNAAAASPPVSPLTEGQVTNCPPWAWKTYAENHAIVCEWLAKRIANKPQGGGKLKGEPADLLTTKELARLANVDIQTFHNELWKGRRSADKAHRPPQPAIKGSGHKPDAYGYAAVRLWLLSTWPARSRYFVESFAEVQKILAAKVAR